MKHILDIIPYTYLPYHAGGQKSVALFSEYLGRQSTLHVAGTSDNDDKMVQSYTFHPILGKSKLRYINPVLLFKILRLIKQKNIAHVIFEHPYLGWMIPILRLFSNIRISTHTHNVESQRFKSMHKKWWRLLAYYERWTLKHSDNVFCIADEDRIFFIENMGIDGSKCITIPYGIQASAPPDDHAAYKSVICHKHQLNPAWPVLIFNGKLDYMPNCLAVQHIIENIAPLLLKKDFQFHILIAGKDLPKQFEEQLSDTRLSITYVGFVEDIDLYTKAADIMLNPVTSGGGVKTKMIEALGNNTTVISTESGAAGVDLHLTGEKLWISKDNDWDSFTDHIIHVSRQAKTITPNEFYDTYYWGSIVKKVLGILAP